MMANPHYQHVHGYLTFVRGAKAHLAKGENARVQLSWSHPHMNAQQWRLEFMSALYRRMDKKAGVVHTGRKHSEMYQTNLKRDARRLQDIRARIRVYQFETPEIKARFSHLLARYDD